MPSDPALEGRPGAPRAAHATQVSPAADTRAARKPAATGYGHDPIGDVLERLEVPKP